MLSVSAKADELGDTYDKGLRLYHEQRYEEAVPFFERTVELSEARYGANNPTIALDLHNLAELYRLTGRYHEAEELYLRAIALDKQNDSLDPVSLAASYNNLALVYRAENRLTEAEQLYEQALVMLEEELGGNHPNVARNLNNLAMVYAAQGHEDRAITLLARAVRISGEILGPTHPTTLALVANQEALASGPVEVASPKAEGHENASRQQVTASGKERDMPWPLQRPQVSTAAPQATGDFLIHLASVRSVEIANSEWRRLAALYQFPTWVVQSPARRIEVEGQSAFYRVAGQGFDTIEKARAVCQSVRDRGEFCQVIIPN